GPYAGGCVAERRIAEPGREGPPRRLQAPGRALEGNAGRGLLGARIVVGIAVGEMRIVYARFLVQEAALAAAGHGVEAGYGEGAGGGGPAGVGGGGGGGEAA